jgi:cyclic beta-1,2-glucan synthetase
LSVEAQIDSLPQSWAVLSGAADPDRARQAIASTDRRLVREPDGLVLLFTPPFEHPSHDPGYVQGYPPGVRENGGQYTHAAIWLAMAHARLGDGERAVQLLRMLNPVEHSRTPADVERYRVEPYAVAADISTLAGHVGQGGWTWYTGSSGWMYRAWLEEILGFRRRGSFLELSPTLPSQWPGFTLHYVHRVAGRESQYAIAVEDPDRVGRGVAWVEVDGRRLAETTIPLQADGQTHRVIVRMGTAAAPAHEST